MKRLWNVFLLLFLLFLTGCSYDKEYKGIKISKLTYMTINYNGGYTTKHLLDFNENKYYSCFFVEEESELELKRSFSDEEEKVFIDACYQKGLFKIKDLYERKGIIDGSGWELSIEYENGETKKSKGLNSSPTKVFNNCSTVFYDLCEEVIGILLKYYINPPNISYAFHCNFENNYVSDNTIADVRLANYKWNKLK